MRSWMIFFLCVPLPEQGPSQIGLCRNRVSHTYIDTDIQIDTGTIEIQIHDILKQPLCFSFNAEIGALAYCGIIPALITCELNKVINYIICFCIKLDRKGSSPMYLVTLVHRSVWSCLVNGCHVAEAGEQNREQKKNLFIDEDVTRRRKETNVYNY